MSKRLPEPGDAKRQRIVFSDTELQRVERMATDCRLSVASFLRAAIIGLADEWPKGMPATRKAADRIEADAPADRPRPGRPKNKETPARGRSRRDPPAER